MTLRPENFIGFYPCRGLERTTQFYQRLGLKIAKDQGSCVIFRVVQNGFLGFCQHDQPQHLSKHSGLILTLVLDDVDGAYRKLTELGVHTEAPPGQNERFGIYHFFARDPDGYRLELQRFDEPLS